MKKSVVLKHFMRLILRLRPSYMILVLVNSLVATGMAVIGIYIPKLLIDGLTQSKGIEWFLSVICVIVAAKLILQILSNYLKKKQDTSREVLRHNVEHAFSEKVMSVDYKYLEDPKYLDIKERATFAVNNFGALDVLLNSAVSFTSAILTLGTVVGIMFSFSPVYMLISIGIAFLTVLVQKKYLSEEQKVLAELIPINRQYSYYSSTAFSLAPQKDIRMYRLDKILIEKLAEKNLEVSKWLSELRRKSGNASAQQTAIISAINLIAYVYAALRVLTDKLGARIGIGDFTVYINASEELIRSFRMAFTSVLDAMQQLGHLTAFAEFIEIPDSDKISADGETLDEIETIEFRNVSFKYPSSEPMILKDVSFKINKGERISIVGLNNAGKSTIVKLICRLFEPTEGEILVNGIDIRRYKLSDYLGQISSVFQDYQLFPFTIEENINTCDVIADTEKIKQILDDIEMTERIAKLPNGVHSLLDKSIYDDAVDMSGGEKQKIAIARALYKGSSLIILDEPTAALDPLAEAEIYEDFNSLISGQTAIFISHRMSSSVFCDRILLLQNGEVAAFNSHENLMKSENLYRELFLTQAAHYQK